jgi:enoyl-CoA hydratase
MDYQILKSNTKQQTAFITISRPKAMNALNAAFFEEMDLLLDDLADNKELRAVVITGEGKAFAAGADIAEMSEMYARQGEAFSNTGQKVFNKIVAFPVPVIAAVNGYALGGGCELATACDIRIASTKAMFGQPEAGLGLIPGYSGTQRLPRTIGKADAAYLLFTGETITADEALRIGLVQKVVEADSLLEEATKVAEKIAAKGPEAIKTLKKTLNEGMQMPFDEAESLESSLFGSLFETAETREGMEAFLNKRKPNW